MSSAPLPAAITSPDEARHLLAPLFADAASEKIIVLHLGKTRLVLAMHEYPGGTEDAVLPLRTVIGQALQLGTTGPIVAHNHPSGNADPSPRTSTFRACLRRRGATSTSG